MKIEDRGSKIDDGEISVPNSVWDRTTTKLCFASEPRRRLLTIPTTLPIVPALLSVTGQGFFIMGR